MAALRTISGWMPSRLRDLFRSLATVAALLDAAAADAVLELHRDAVGDHVRKEVARAVAAQLFAAEVQASSSLSSPSMMSPLVTTPTTRPLSRSSTGSRPMPNSLELPDRVDERLVGEQGPDPPGHAVFDGAVAARPGRAS